MKRQSKSTVLALLSILAATLAVVNANVAGVDFGGEFFKIALVKPGTPFEIVTNVHSKRKTETMVAFDGEERLYGADAATSSIRRPYSAYTQVRRLLGNHVDHPHVTSLTTEEYLPYKFESNSTRNTVSLVHSDEDVYSAEEVVAMVFAHARHITEVFAEAKVRDWVLTVPSFFDQAQRKALLDAAELAGIRVLSLIDENTAASLQHAVHSTFDAPKNVLIYNMGSTSTQVQVVRFESQVVPDGFKKNKTISSFRVLSKAWDATLGSSQFDLRLANHLADEFTSNTNIEVKKNPKAMAKLRAHAKKTKVVLSANEDIPVSLQSLADDRDLMTHVTRSQLEKMSSDLFDRALTPVSDALEASGLSIDQIDDIELVGGGVRMPRVQSQLKRMFNDKDLGVHLNGDEAMALGAAFYGANLSNAFRVRQVGMTDISSYAIGAKFEANDWKKRSSVFPKGSALGGRKMVTFQLEQDVTCHLQYDDANALPKGSKPLINGVRIQGIEDAATEMKEKEVEGAPQVTVSFELDSHGLVQVSKAVASYDVQVDSSSEDESPTTKTIEKKLIITSLYDSHPGAEELAALSLTKYAKDAAKARLDALDAADTKRRVELEAKNALESYIFHAMDTLSSKKDELAQVSTSEMLSSFESQLDDALEWLEDGEHDGASSYNSKRKTLKEPLDAMLFRLKELTDFPQALNDAEEYAFSVREMMKEWMSDKPQVTDEERQDVLSRVEELETYLKEKGEEKKEQAKHLPPTITSTDIQRKASNVRRLVGSLAKKPKPVVKEEEASSSSADMDETVSVEDTETSEEDKSETETEERTEEAHDEL